MGISATPVPDLLKGSSGTDAAPRSRARALTALLTVVVVLAALGITWSVLHESKTGDPAQNSEVGSTSAPMLDVERTNTNVIIVETPATASTTVTETSTVNAMTTPAEVTEITTTTTPAEVAEVTTTTDVPPAGMRGVPVGTQSGGLPSPIQNIRA